MILASSYPVVYCILVIPLSVVRWLEFHQEDTGTKQNHVPSWATLTVASIFSLTGIADVILFFVTRQGLLLFGDHDPPPTVQVCAGCGGGGGGVPMNTLQYSGPEFGDPDVGPGVQRGSEAGTSTSGRIIDDERPDDLGNGSATVK